MIRLARFVLVGECAALPVRIHPPTSVVRCATRDGRKADEFLDPLGRRGKPSPFLPVVCCASISPRSSKRSIGVFFRNLQIGVFLNRPFHFTQQDRKTSVRSRREEGDRSSRSGRSAMCECGRRDARDGGAHGGLRCVSKEWSW